MHGHTNVTHYKHINSVFKLDMWWINSYVQ